MNYGMNDPLEVFWMVHRLDTCPFCTVVGTVDNPHELASGDGFAEVICRDCGYPIAEIGDDRDEPAMVRY